MRGGTEEKNLVKEMLLRSNTTREFGEYLLSGAVLLPSVLGRLPP